MSEQKEKKYTGRKVFDIVYGAVFIPWGFYLIATKGFSIGIALLALFMVGTGLFSLYTAFFKDYAETSKQADDLSKAFYGKLFKAANHFDPQEREVRKIEKSYKKNNKK